MAAWTISLVLWNPNKKSKVPAAWNKAYPDAEYQVINPDNYQDWLLRASR